MHFIEKATLQSNPYLILSGTFREKKKLLHQNCGDFLAYAILWQCCFYGNCTFQTCKRIEKDLFLLGGFVLASPVQQPEGA